MFTFIWNADFANYAFIRVEAMFSHGFHKWTSTVIRASDKHRWFTWPKINLGYLTTL